MPPSEARDDELVERSAAGDAEALAELYDRHSSTVFGLLLRILRRHAEAEEILQDVFLEVWRKAATFRPDRASPKGWILLIARSRGLDRLRSRDARSRREQDSAGHPEGRRVANPAGPERLEHGERRRRLAGALSILPEEQRRAIEHAFFEGLSHRQIAERTGDPLGTVKSRILLGMKKLRRHLESGS